MGLTKKNTMAAMEVILIQLPFYTVVFKQRIKMKTPITIVPLHYLKVNSTQNKVVTFFSCLAHRVYCHISLFGLMQRFSDNSSLPILVDAQRLHENGK